MNITEEILKLIYRTEGTEELSEAEKKVHALQRRIKDLTDSYEQGNVRAADYRRELQALQRQTTQAVGETEKMGRASKMNASDLLTLSYALDDLQYGFRGVANNIPMVLSALGMGAGLAGVVSMAATLIVGFGDKIVAAIGPEKAKAIAGGLGSIQEKLKELEDRNVKLGIDYKAIEAGKELLKEFEAAIQRAEQARQQMSPDERSAGETFTRMAAESPLGARKLQDAVIRNVSQEMRAEDAAELGRLEQEAKTAQGRADMDPLNPTKGFVARRARQAFEDRQNEIRNAARERVMATFGRAQGGDQGAIAEFIEMTQRANVGPRTVDMLSAATPERLAESKRMDVQLAAVRAQRELDAAKEAGQQKLEDERQRNAEKVFGPSGAMEQEARVKAQAAADNAEQQQRNIERVFGPSGAMEREAKVKDDAIKRMIDQAADVGMRAFGAQLESGVFNTNMRNPQAVAALQSQILQKMQESGIDGGPEVANELMRRATDMAKQNSAVWGPQAAAMMAVTAAQAEIAQRVVAAEASFSGVAASANQVRQYLRRNGGGNFRPGL